MARALLASEEQTQEHARELANLRCSSAMGHEEVATLSAKIQELEAEKEVLKKDIEDGVNKLEEVNRLGKYTVFTGF